MLGISANEAVEKEASSKTVIKHTLKTLANDEDK